MKIVLVEDDREKKNCITVVSSFIISFIPCAFQQNYVIEQARLEKGDYALMLDINGIRETIMLIERKSYQDFRASFVSKRLAEQIEGLLIARKEGKTRRIALLLEGKRPSTPEDLRTGRPSYYAIEQMLNVWKYKRDIDILRSNSPDDSGRELFFKMRYFHDMAIKCIPSISNGISSDAGPSVDSSLNTSKSMDKTDNPYKQSAWKNEMSAIAERQATQAAQHHKKKEPWVYLSMYLSMFPGISFERAKDISKSFDNSMRKFVQTAIETPSTFKFIMQDKENPKYNRGISLKTIDELLNVITLERL